MVNVNCLELIKTIADAVVIFIVLVGFFSVVYVVPCDHNEKCERLKSELRNIDGKEV